MQSADRCFFLLVLGWCHRFLGSPFTYIVSIVATAYCGYDKGTLFFLSSAYARNNGNHLLQKEPAKERTCGGIFN
jgi:hypothetical protein